jgi:hypothetical protein
MNSFSAKILILGINPYVPLPERVLAAIFKQAQKSKGPIPVQGTLNGKRFQQTLVRYQGAWRLYLNTPMRRAAAIDVGDTVRVRIEYDPEPRTHPMNPALARALARNKVAKAAFQSLAPSRQKEVVRYLNNLKAAASVEQNVKKVIEHLSGKEAEPYALMRSSKRRSQS